MTIFPLSVLPLLFCLTCCSPMPFIGMAALRRAALAPEALGLLSQRMALSADNSLLCFVSRALFLDFPPVGEATHSARPSHPWECTSRVLGQAKRVSAISLSVLAVPILRIWLRRADLAPGCFAPLSPRMALSADNSLLSVLSHVLFTATRRHYDVRRSRRRPLASCRREWH